MSGYYGYSMSNNAVSAYESGEKPLSKWTKTAILEGIRALIGDELPEDFPVDECAKMKASDLKARFLYNSSWHHTSKFYNKTEFYKLDTDNLLEWFGYSGFIQAETPDGVKLGDWAGPRDPVTGKLTKFVDRDGAEYDSAAVKFIASVYVRL